MEILIISVVLIIGLVLLVAELYLFPGISLAGICATGCFIFANVYAYITSGGLACLITLLITIVGCGLLIYSVFHSKSFDKVALNKDIDSTVRNHDTSHIHVGDEGKATTRLALIGNADINGYNVEVRSVGGYIDEQTPIRVERIVDDTILVAPLPTPSPTSSN